MISSDCIELIAFTPNARLMMQLKTSGNKEMVDFRTWIKWSQDKQFHPKRENAMMIEKRYLKPVMLKAIAIIEAQECNNKVETSVKQSQE